MKFRQKRRVVKISLFLLILGILVGTFFLFISQKKYILTSEESTSSKLALGKGISFVEYHGDKKVYSVSIDSFSIESSRIGPFIIGPLNMAVLNKVTVDLNLDEIEPKLDKERLQEKGAEGGIPNFENPILNIKKNLPLQGKKIRVFRLKDITFNLWRKGEKIFRISSDTARVDRKMGDLIFEGHATMNAGENGNLISHRIRWNRKTHLFGTTDRYVLTKNETKKEGEGIETDYLFKRINYRPSNKQK